MQDDALNTSILAYHGNKNSKEGKVKSLQDNLEGRAKPEGVEVNGMCILWDAFAGGPAWPLRSLMGNFSVI